MPMTVEHAPAPHRPSAADAQLLRVQNLHVSFTIAGGRIEAVRGVDFTLRRGRVLALVGESGSGKSVIAQSILRLLPKAGRIDRGRILFRDPAGDGSEVDIAALRASDPLLRRLRGGRMSMVFQEPMSALSPLHTIGDQVEEALRLHRRIGADAAREATHDVLGLVGFPDPRAGYARYPFELSGGLRQRAVIAMALICDPALVIADEPTTALDVTVQAQILALLRSLQQRLHTTILLITHDLGVVANMADDVVVMHRGEVMEAAPMRSIFANPRHPYLKALMAAVPRLDHEPGKRLACLRDLDDGHLQAIERVSARFHSATQRAGGDGGAPGPHLEVQALCKQFVARSGGWFGSHARLFTAVDQVSFTLRRGECLGLVGESGSGKTTVSKLILRALTATSGHIRLHGSDGAPLDVLALERRELFEYRRRVQMIFQDPYSSLNPRLTVRRILSEPFEIHRLCAAAEREQELSDLMKLVGLDPRFLSRYPHSFSGGQRQRIGIARALALRPELLVCDEPVSALDVSVQAQILNLLNDLRRELGLTMLFVSHNLAVVNYVADRIAVMYRGRVVEIGPREALFSAPAHPYTRSLLASVPEPDPDRPLNLAATLTPSAGELGGWAPAFCSARREELEMLTLSPGHAVLARPSADVRELAA
jgi:peptide/nickel transport system ATP-binding protein